MQAPNRTSDPADGAEPGSTVCAACGGRLSPGPSIRGPDRLLGTPGVFEVHECERCGAGLTLPLATAAELDAFYAGSYAPYVAAAGRVQRMISAVLQKVQGSRALRKPPLATIRGLPPGRALDVGCGRGDLGAQLVARNWRVTGIDPSEAACEVARARGLDARAGTVHDVGLEPQSFDVAILQHSLEHVPKPAEDLRRIHAALREGGLLTMIMPNFGSWQRKRFGSRWFHLDLPRHRVHFTRRALAGALERTGFEIEELGTSTTSVGLPASIQYVVFGRCLFPGGLSHRVVVGACIALYPFIRLADLLAGDGDVLHVVARKLS